MPQSNDNSLTWVEISRSALLANFQLFRQLTQPGVQLCPTIKSNAYGHDLLACGQILRGAGAEYLAVNALCEARRLRAAGDTGRIYVLGYTSLADLAEAVALDLDLVVYNAETIQKLAQLIDGSSKQVIRLHLKVETGVHRQGVCEAEALELAQLIRDHPGLQLVGVTAHFANVEDTTDHSYARQQLARFQEICAALHAAHHHDFLRHIANSAATLLWPQAHFDLVRFGIATYGLWPSEEAFVSLAAEQKEKIVLRPVLTWKTRVAQVRQIPAGAKVGYGCTWTADRPTRLAILPIGYYDGYARAGSGSAWVLIAGARAPVVGRICMNIIMVDVTDLPQVQLEDEVVLLGKQGEEEISAEELAAWSGTINYEVTTRIREGIERRLVE